MDRLPISEPVVNASYQALARKWRPRTFQELVGQTHIVRTLGHALDNGRLHHAFLFTGTRGVGKTTIARIFAKSLNCERGVSASPCGVCSACREIDEGRFVDLLEVDAASRTGVDDTRELLENVQYAPARGRYKVYLIDEVHMFSRSSFNALLKTLEEPPPHVKFLLATTDPQRLPVTVLSRCLQFPLKRLPLTLIRDRLIFILGQEQIPHEDTAITLLARAGDGSLRDALSLLDQAVAFGGGQVLLEPVEQMLGTLDRGRVVALLESLIAGDGAALLRQVASLDELAPDYEAVLAALLSLLQQLALHQMVPDADPGEDYDPVALAQLAANVSPDAVQLFYQIGLLGRRDLPLAPEPRGGFEMVLLRMLCFRPGGDEPAPPSPTPPSPPSQRRQPSTVTNVATEPPVRSAAAALAALRKTGTQQSESCNPVSTSVPVATSAAVDSPPQDHTVPAMQVRKTNPQTREAEPPPQNPSVAVHPVSREPEPSQPTEPNQPTEPTVEPTELSQPMEPGWHTVVAQLNASGLALELARHTVLQRQEGDTLYLSVEPSFAARSPSVEERLQTALEAYYGRSLRLVFEVATDTALVTPARRHDQAQAQRREVAVRTIHEDPNIQTLMAVFDAQVQEESIAPLDD